MHGNCAFISSTCSALHINGLRVNRIMGVTTAKLVILSTQTQGSPGQKIVEMAKKKSAKKSTKRESAQLQASVASEVSPSTERNNPSLPDSSKDHTDLKPVNFPFHENPPLASVSASTHEAPQLDNLNLNGAASVEPVEIEHLSKDKTVVDLTKDLKISTNSSSLDFNNQKNSTPASSEILEALKTQLEQVETERDEIQEEYDYLVEKVATIKQRLGERFKELKAETSKAKAEAEQVRKSAEATLKERLESAKRDSDLALRKAINEAREEAATSSQKEAERVFQKELAKVQSELKKTQNEVEKYKSEATRTRNEVSMARELQVSQKVMFDQELANERVAKQTLEVELEQLNAKFESNSSVSSQLNHTCELQEQEIAKLKRKIHTSEEAFDDLKAKYNTEIADISKERDYASKQLIALRAQLASHTQSFALSAERQQKLESEAKENQLLIGKLRHEAVILNDHLTHALRLVRKDSEGTTVDKELVSNLFVQFATCPRQDTKKFEILLLIANFLGWDEQRRKIVGLEKENQEFELQNQIAQNPPQMVGMVGKLAEFLESRRSSGSK